MLVGRGAVHGLSFFVKKIYKRKKSSESKDLPDFFTSFECRCRAFAVYLFFIRK